MIYSCRRVAELTSQELDTPLPLNKRLALGVHRLMCSACRRFRTQLREIDRAIGEYVCATSRVTTVRLPDESKMRIKEVLREASSGDVGRNST